MKTYGILMLFVGVNARTQTRIDELKMQIAELELDLQLESKSSILPDFDSCADAPILSWHIHLSFHANDPVNCSSALALRDLFISEFNIQVEVCPMGHLEPAESYDQICPFPLEYDADGPYSGTGPFDLPNFSFFIPATGELLNQAVQWWTQNKGPYSILVHPNSGCQDWDHGTWPMRAGPETTLNVPQGLACCHSGPSGCTCYVALFIPQDYSDDENTYCVYSDADTGAMSVIECVIEDYAQTSLFTTTNYTSDFAQIESFLTYPREDRCVAPLSGTCEEGSLLALMSCTEGDDTAINSTRLSYNVGLSMITLDACEGLCVAANSKTNELVVATCGTEGTKFDRLCAMAPNNVPVTCPDVNY
jgi:hypothetical protein